MKESTRLRIHRFNVFLDTPMAVLIALVLLFGYFAVGNIRFERENQHILQSTKDTLDNTSTIIKNLQQAVNDLKADNQRQTRYISCLLALQGRGDLVAPDVQNQCEKMSSNVGINDVTKTPAPQASQTPAAQTPTNQNQGADVKARCKVDFLFLHIGCEG